MISSASAGNDERTKHAWWKALNKDARGIQPHDHVHRARWLKEQLQRLVGEATC
jgi:hypothetical protein